MSDLQAMTLVDLRDAIAAGEVTAMQATRFCLDRIEQYNPTLNAFVEVYSDRATERALRIDRDGHDGLLAGVPIAIKDIFATDYGHTTCGSNMLATFKAPYTATAVQRLEEAGAIILGKTNMDEFAMGSSCETSCHGPTRNPFDIDYVPGGSSGGAAAAMAARLCFGSIGTDTGGSIRQPAAYTATVGFKPSYGRVSRFGMVAFASSLDQAGAFALTPTDAGVLTQVMSGHDPLDSTSAKLQPMEYAVDPELPNEGKLRIGLAREYLSDNNHTDVQAAVDQAIERFKDHGAKIVDVTLPHTEAGIACYYIVATAEASSNLARYDGVHYGHRTRERCKDITELYAKSRSEAFGDEVKRRIMLGTHVLCSGYVDAYYNRALKVRRLIQRDFTQAFEQCDVILCPTTPTPAFKLGEKSDDPLTMYLNDVYTVPASLAGLPAVSLPGNSSDAALPVGVQLIGPAFKESMLLRIAQELEPVCVAPQLN